MVKYYSNFLYLTLGLTDKVEHHGGPKNDAVADRLGALNLKQGLSAPFLEFTGGKL